VGIVPGCGQVLLGEPLSVRLGDVVVSGDPSFYAGEVGGPLVELFAGLLQRDAELPSEGPEAAGVTSSRAGSHPASRHQTSQHLLERQRMVSLLLLPSAIRLAT
jgi:hypothetical protein